MQPKKIKLEEVQKPICSFSEFPLFVASIELASENLVEGDVFVEIGTERSVKGLKCIIQCLHILGLERFKTYSIDHEHGKVKKIKRVYNDLLQVFNWDRRNSEIILRRSQAPETQAQVKGPIAWLYIDGCHCYECVFHDIRNWVPRVKVGGILGFHDTNPKSWKGKSSRCLNRGGEKALWGVLPAIQLCESNLQGFRLLGEVTGRKPGIRFYRRIK